MGFRHLLIWAALPMAAALLWVVPSGAADLVPPEFLPVEIEVSKGTLIRLEAPADQVFIAEPEVADIQVKSPRLIYVFGKRPGQTTLYAVDADERVLVRRTVVVAHNLSALGAAIEVYLPNAAVDVTSLEGSVVLTGKVATASQAETLRTLASQLVADPAQLINWVTVSGPNQINIRVRLAEMSRDTAKKVGFNFQLAQQFGTQGLLTLFSGIPGGLIDGTTVPDAFAFNFDNASTQLNLLIDLLEEEGLVQTLAQPNLTALSGETASFLVGGEFPIPVQQRDDRVTIQFKEFGIKLDFRPQLTGDNRISLRVRNEVSQLSNQGAIQLDDLVVPALTTRRAETTVEVGSGQSFAIAGLLSDQIRHQLRKYPGLGNIPVIGILFRSDTFLRDETELVIIVTAYVVRPSGGRLAGPIDGFRPPSDQQRVISGSRFRQALPPGPSPASGGGASPLIGPTGYVLN